MDDNQVQQVGHSKSESKKERRAIVDSNLVTVHRGRSFNDNREIFMRQRRWLIAPAAYQRKKPVHSFFFKFLLFASSFEQNYNWLDSLILIVLHIQGTFYLLILILINTREIPRVQVDKVLRFF